MYSLGIIQTHITQFDGPLFRLLAGCPDIELTVYFTRSDGHRSSFDPELNHTSGWDRDLSEGFRYYSFPTNLLGRVQMTQKIASAGHDLIIIAGYASIWLLLIVLLSKLYGTPVGLRADSVLIYRKVTTWKWRLKDIILPRLYSLCTTLHPVGTLARSMMLHYGFHAEGIFVFPYAVDNSYLRDKFEVAYLQRKVLREEIGVKPNDHVILGVLKFVSREDPITLVEAYIRIIKSIPNTSLILVGDGILREEIEKLLVRHSVTNKVHLPGYVPYSHLPRYFAVADIFVHPAQVEPWGVTINEAMVCGLPTIAADTVGAAYDLIKDGETGFIFRAADISSLTQKLENLLEDIPLRETMKKNAFEQISHWSYAVTIDQIRCALEYVTSLNSRNK